MIVILRAMESVQRATEQGKLAAIDMPHLIVKCTVPCAAEQVIVERVAASAKWKQAAEKVTSSVRLLRQMRTTYWRNELSAKRL